ncbi:MAG: hypothetical protein A2140_01170 [Candidatus Muproteobacteria bacterium RBG_16_62_13]|uniref:Uncharacterized protein n=1 Tax=Candidatus Muproteobacteria bacterium RBG_16_62_13 TaxID=1817756 RepID=A0A1F6T3K8_9PROT|nr:MAG: hypothetical protein A2140_01170 [Candidatus Muproteobacteria bacterium RBG_16_62_13]
MLHLQSQIEIDVPAADTFRLLCDPARKTALNPAIELLSAALVSAGPVGQGSRIHYHLRTGAGVRSFHCTVTAFAPDRLIEMESDTSPPFRVRQTLEATLYGCSLLHEEWLDDGAVALPAQTHEQPLPILKRLLQEAIGHGLPSTTLLRERQREALRDQLLQSLALWLGNIKDALEIASQAAPAENSALAT